uniref:Uncharacterized protein n=1 Tax=Ditylum brightwellii TaxID=49249 RepID=A0A7S2ESC8_9STRA
MVDSNLDLTNNNTDDPMPIIVADGSDSNDTVTPARRSKRDHETPLSLTYPNNDFITSFANSSALALPFVFIFHFIGMMKVLMFSLMRHPFQAYQQIADSNNEVNEVLETMPKKNEVLQRDVKKVGRDQVILDAKLENLRERIQRIENKRKAWDEAAKRIEKEQAEMTDKEKAERKEKNAAIWDEAVKRIETAKIEREEKDAANEVHDENE